MNLVYYTLGYSGSYLDVIGLSIASLRRSGYTGHIAVLCDEMFLAQCKATLGPDILYKTFPNSTTPEQASMNKLRIFDLPDIDSYDRVLFLDSDILVHMDTAPLFQSIVTPGTLYVYTETTKQEDHQALYWGLQSYSPEDLVHFRETNVHVFNAGCFAFVREDGMKRHFLAVLRMIDQHTGPFFYEQSFLNVYFNRTGATDRTLLTSANYVLNPDRSRAYPGHLVHFSGDPGSGPTKYQRMAAYIRVHLTT